jgi:hypothetical protein
VQARSQCQDDVASPAREERARQKLLAGDCLFDPHLDGSYNKLNQTDSTDDATLDDYVDGDFGGWFRRFLSRVP